MTLRGGQFAGIFHDRGPVKNMQECMHMCCNTKNCDVAMMHGPKCFSVRCLNDSTCETIPADDDDIDMQIAHMTTKGTRELSECNRRLDWSNCRLYIPPPGYWLI